MSQKRALVDTNVLLRLVVPADSLYPIASAAIANLEEQAIDLCIASQNVVEFWAVATRPLANNGLGMGPIQAADRLRRLRDLFTLLEGARGVVEEWERLVLQHSVLGKQTHDAHLVAAMNIYGVHRILTFNGDHFQRFPSIEVISPASVLTS